MQDDDDKVRRNLVVFSTLVLASEFLDIQEFGLLRHVFAGSNFAPEPWRLTALAMLALLYLLLRYRFAATSADALETVRNDWGSVRQAKITRLLQGGVSAFNSFHFQPSFIKTNLEQMSQSEIEEWTRPHADAGRKMAGYIVTDRSEYAGKVSRMKFSDVSGPHLTEIWQGTAHADKTFFVANRLVGRSSGGQGISFSFGLISRLVVRATTALHMSIYSKSAIIFFTPVVLSMLAMSVLICRLASQRLWL